MALHETGIQQFGGIYGIRDKNALDAAIMQPRQSFGGVDLYPTLFTKAAAYAYFISQNHPFLDGNKRTAISAAAVFLDLNGYEIKAPAGAIYKLMINVAEKKFTPEQLATWFYKNSRRKKSSSEVNA